MRNFLTDVYKDVSYVLDEDGYNQSEYQDIVRKRFVKAWEGLVEGYKVSSRRRRFLAAYSLRKIGYFHREQLPPFLWART